jgi:hypothetical protein
MSRRLPQPPTRGRAGSARRAGWKKGGERCRRNKKNADSSRITSAPAAMHAPVSSPGVACGWPALRSVTRAGACRPRGCRAAAPRCAACVPPRPPLRHVLLLRAPPVGRRSVACCALPVADPWSVNTEVCGECGCTAHAPLRALSVSNACARAWRRSCLLRPCFRTSRFSTSCGEPRRAAELVRAGRAPPYAALLCAVWSSHSLPCRDHRRRSLVSPFCWCLSSQRSVRQAVNTRWRAVTPRR